MITVYIDGIFDLFHRGHLECLLKAKQIRTNEEVHLIVGLIDDETAKGYKRPPICNQDDRYAVLSNIRCVGQVIFPAPLIITRDFVKRHNIDIIVHGFSDSSDMEKQKEFTSEVEDIFETIPYYSFASTTALIKRIKEEY